MRLKKASILGAGSWGTAISMLLAEKADEVFLWGRDAKAIHEINHKRVNRRYLPREEVPENVTATTDFADLSDSKILVMVTPSAATREVAASAAEAVSLEKDVPIVSATKGIEASSGKRMTEILAESFVGHPVAVLSGPNHAEEVARHMATASVIGCDDQAVADRLQAIFTLPFFRTYTSDDVVGIEYGGAVKNVFSLAGGIADGLGLGDNAKAALVTRGCSSHHSQSCGYEKFHGDSLTRLAWEALPLQQLRLRQHSLAKPVPHSPDPTPGKDPALCEWS